MLVEVCANSLDSALAAQEGGADCIELCTELGVGGITPSYGLIKMVREKLDIPIRVLIRPRSGHFTYTEHEFEVMLKDIVQCKALGIDGIVSGVLLPDFTIDFERTARLVEASLPMGFTFHRAFDWVKDPKHALSNLEQLGVDRVLSSGQEKTAEQGLGLLGELNAITKGCLVMAGGGINMDNCKKMMGAGLRAIHFSATSFESKISVEGKISMNTATHLHENIVAVTNLKTVRQIVQSVK